MPYVKPPVSPESSHHLDLPPLKLRSKHRRTRSANPTFSDECGPGAFAPLALPRRKTTSERKALFHFDDAHDSDSSDTSPQPEREDGTPSKELNALKLTVDTMNVPSNSPSRESPPPFKPSSLPFPSRGSPLPSPLPPSPSSSPLPRTPSTPIILSNGKPLKPSLKSSHSSPHVPGLRLHMRAQSEPATPSNGAITPKNVHFAGDEKLRSVRVFNKEGKPVNVNKTNAEETETETEYDSSNPNGMEPSAFPFPRQFHSVPVVEEIDFELETEASSPIPTSMPSPYANVHVETLVLPRGCPPVLRGSVIVRNVAFAKEVAVRFTLDDWCTTSEVICKYVASLPSLPPPFPTPHTHGDKVAATSTWDRFSFMINLEDFERKLHEKTLYLVARFSSPGVGEWWDNNGTDNYRVRFRKRTTTKPGSQLAKEVVRMSPAISHSQQRTFSAPSTLKSTPTTEAVQAVAQGRQEPPPKISLPPQNLRAHRMSLPRPSPPIRHNSSPQPITLSSLGKNRSAAAQLYASVPTKLNLMNYAAPTTPSTDSPTPRASDSLSENMVGMSDAAPVLSPSVTISRILSPIETPSAQTPMQIVGGMPATAPRYELSWSVSTDSSTASLNDTTPPPLYSALPVASESEKQRAKNIVSSPSSSLSGDSMYAAFVKQWCFVQSPTPSPSIHSEGTVTPTPTPPSSGGTSAAATRAASASAWRGMDAFFGNGVRSESPMLTSR